MGFHRPLSFHSLFLTESLFQVNTLCVHREIIFSSLSHFSTHRCGSKNSRLVLHCYILITIDIIFVLLLLEFNILSVFFVFSSRYHLTLPQQVINRLELLPQQLSLSLLFLSASRQETHSTYLIDSSHSRDSHCLT